MLIWGSPQHKLCKDYQDILSRHGRDIMDYKEIELLTICYYEMEIVSIKACSFWDVLL